jgi:hypothetical protein
MKNSIAILLLSCAFGLMMLVLFNSGCVTSSSSNGITTVNTNNLILDCGVLQGLVTAGAKVALADPKISVNARTAMTDINVIIAGVISGASTNSPTQIAALISGQVTDPQLATDIAPVVNFLSGLEQNALARYGSENWEIIGIAMAKAIGAGITQALQ